MKGSCIAAVHPKLCTKCVDPTHVEIWYKLSIRRVKLSLLSRFCFVNFIFDISSYQLQPAPSHRSLSLRETPVNSISIPWGAAPRFLWDTGSDVFRPKSVPSSPMVKRAFSRLGTITAGWGRSIRKHGSGNTLQSEDRKRWASSQDCSSTFSILMRKIQ